MLSLRRTRRDANNVAVASAVEVLFRVGSWMPPLRFFSVIGHRGLLTAARASHLVNGEFRPDR